MESESGRRGRLPGLRPEKREAILSGAAAVFAREGFGRASVDAIAAESQVSTRTIYKHFTDKSTLVAAVVADSAGRIAEDEIALVEQHLGVVSELRAIESALTAFAIAWLSITVRPAVRAGLIERVYAEAEQLDPEVIDAWWKAGPLRVRKAVAEQFERWGSEGLLVVPDPMQAAVHFAQLVSATPGPPGSQLTQRKRRTWVAAGVQVFLRGYLRN